MVASGSVHGGEIVISCVHTYKTYFGFLVNSRLLIDLCVKMDNLVIFSTKDIGPIVVDIADTDAEKKSQVARGTEG